MLAPVGENSDPPLRLNLPDDNAAAFTETRLVGDVLAILHGR